MANVNGPLLPVGTPSMGKSAPDSNPSLKDRLGFAKDAIMRAISKPLVIGGSNINPLSAGMQGTGEEALQRIDQLADRGLQRAAVRGVGAKQVAAGLHAELDRILGQRNAPAPEEGSIPEKGPIAAIPHGPYDPEVTRALPLQERVKATKWDEEMVKNRDALCASLSAFSAVYQMRERAGGIKESDNTKLQQIVFQATKPGETRSLWDHFCDQYNLTIGQKLRAGFVYWFYYKTSLISNTIDAYLKTFIEGLTKDLIKSDQTRLKFIRRFLEESNSFLVEDIRATKQFAYAAEPGGGDLEDFRKRAIVNHYGGSLEKLCKAFSEQRVQEGRDTLYVPFFPHLREIPLLKWVFRGVEYLLNRFIIQTAMQKAILPPILKSSIENGVQVTQPDNIAFALEVTRFLNTQLEQLRQKLDDPTPSASATTPLPGTENLPALIKNLTLLLDLEPYRTQLELRQKFQEIEKGKWIHDQQVEQIIENGIKEGCHHLFTHLNELFRTSEAFARILELSRTAVAGKGKDPATLQAEYKEQEAKLKRTAGDIFQKIIQVAVDKTVKGNLQKPEEAKKAATEAFEDGKKVAKKVLDELRDLCRQMTQKISRSGQASTLENNIQSDIASFLQFMQIFSTRKEIQDRINALQDVNKEAIWRIVTPIYEQAARIQGKILVLQELQDNYPSHTAVADQFKLVRETTQLIYEQFHVQLGSSLDRPIQDLQKTSDEIAKSLGNRAPATLHLNRQIESISNLSTNIASEQKLLNALFTLSPPRNEGAPQQQLGLLDQLLHYERGTHPRGFQPKACLREINQLLTHFSAQEQKELRTLIDTGSNLSTRWPRLGAALQTIYERHKAIQDRDSARFDEMLRETALWAQDKVDKYTQIKNQDHLDMQKLMREISNDVNRLRRDAYNLQPDLPIRVNSGATRVIAAAAGAAAGWSISTVFGALGGVVGGFFNAGTAGAAIGATAGPAAIGMLRNAAGMLSKDPGAIAKTTVVYPLISGALSAFSPVTSSHIAMAAGGLTGLEYQELLHKNSQQWVLPKVMHIFESAYKLIRSPRIYEAAATRALKALT